MSRENPSTIHNICFLIICTFCSGGCQGNVIPSKGLLDQLDEAVLDALGQPTTDILGRTDEEIARDRAHDRERLEAQIVVSRKKRVETQKKWADRTMSAQQMLNSLGYECGEPTGVIDEQTRIAVIDYQYDHALETTGWIDDPLVRHLENTIADH